MTERMCLPWPRACLGVLLACSLLPAATLPRVELASPALVGSRGTGPPAPVTATAPRASDGRASSGQGVMKRQSRPGSAHVACLRPPRPTDLLRLAGAGGEDSAWSARSMLVAIQHRESGTTARMRFTVREERGQLLEVEASWEGHDLSAPVESAEDLVFLCATILGRDVRTSALWLAIDAPPPDVGSGAPSQNSRLHADSAAALWRQLSAACRRGMVLVVADADAAELAEWGPPPPPAGDPSSLREYPEDACARSSQTGGGSPGAAAPHQTSDLVHLRTATGRGTPPPPPPSAPRALDDGSTRIEHEARGGGERGSMEAAMEAVHEEEQDGGASGRPARSRPVSLGSPAASSRPAHHAGRPVTRVRKVALKVRHVESGRRQALVLYASQVGHEALGTVGAQGDAGLEPEIDGHVKVLWPAGRAAFNLTSVKDLTVFVSRMMRLDPGKQSLFVAATPRPAQHGERRHELPDTMGPLALWRLATNATRGATSALELLLARRGRAEQERHAAGGSLAAGASGVPTAQSVYGRGDASADPLPLALSAPHAPPHASLAVHLRHTDAPPPVVGADTQAVFRGRVTWRAAGKGENWALDVQTRLEWTEGALAVEVRDGFVVEDIVKLVAPVLGVLPENSALVLDLDLPPKSPTPTSVDSGKDLRARRVLVRCKYGAQLVALCRALEARQQPLTYAASGSTLRLADGGDSGGLAPASACLAILDPSAFRARSWLDRRLEAFSDLPVSFGRGPVSVPHQGSGSAPHDSTRGSSHFQEGHSKNWEKVNNVWASVGPCDLEV